MGSVQKRVHESGAVVYRARYRLPDGRERSKTFPRKADAEKWLRNRLSEVDRGDWSDPAAGRALFRDVAAEWQRFRRNYRPKTIETTVSLIRAQLIPTFGDVRVSTIRPRDIEAWALALQEEGYAAGTIRSTFAILKSILARAVREQRIATNPADSVRLRDLLDTAPRTARVSILDPAEVSALLSKLPKWWRPYTLTLYGSGCRVGELSALLEDDFDGSALHISKTLGEANRQIHVGPPKTAESVRVVPLPASVCEVIEGMQRHVRAERLFSTVRGNVVRPTAYAQIFSRAAKDIGRPDATPHTLRHSHASLLLHEGASIIAVSQRLGHRNPQVTLETYAHLMKGADEALADVFDSFTRPIRGLYVPDDPENGN